MIAFENLSKSFWVKETRKLVIDNLNLTLPSGKSLALMGRNGAGKSTLMQMIAGTMRPDRGRIISDGTISWPVGLGASMHGDMTGAQNICFVARIYGVDTQSLVDFVEDFAELGRHYHMPVRSYSAGMRARLAFGASMGIKFDTYLVDETTAVGDQRFRAKSQEIFRARMKTSGAIFVAHDSRQLREFCDSGLILEQGRVRYYENLEEGIAAYKEMMSV